MAAMNITLTVHVRLEHVEGKFASKDEMIEALISELESCDPGSLSGDEGGEYETTEWTVES